jgi:hypothetical protein
LHATKPNDGDKPLSPCVSCPAYSRLNLPNLLTFAEAGLNPYADVFRDCEPWLATPPAKTGIDADTGRDAIPSGGVLSTVPHLGRSSLVSVGCRFTPAANR